MAGWDWDGGAGVGAGGVGVEVGGGGGGGGGSARAVSGSDAATNRMQMLMAMNVRLVWVVIKSSWKTLWVFLYPKGLDQIYRLCSSERERRAVEFATLMLLYSWPRISWFSSTAP